MDETKTTRISNIAKILKGTYSGIPSAVSSPIAALGIATTASSFSKPSFKSVSSLSPFTGPSSNTAKSISYILIGIITFIALILFLQSLGMQIIQERGGSNGYFMLPFGDQSLINLTDTVALRDINPYIYTINIPIYIGNAVVKNVGNPVCTSGNNPIANLYEKPILIFYRGINYAYKSKLTNGSTDKNNIDSYFDSIPSYQFAVALDGITRDLCIFFYDSKPTPQKHSVLLKNPPLDVTFNLTIVVNKTYAEVYSNGLLTKTVVLDNSIFAPSTANFNLITNSDITIEPSNVSLWSKALLASEIGKLNLINTPIKKSSWYKFW